MKKGISLFLAVLLILGMALPAFAAEETVIDETNFTPFKISVITTGSAAGVKRLVLSTDNFPFALNTANQLTGCLLNGTVTYSGTGNYSKSVPFENVQILTSDVRTGRTAISFVVPKGYTIVDNNSEDSKYTWDLTISPKTKESSKTDVPESGTTFFVLPDMFKSTDNWKKSISDSYTILCADPKPKNDISTSVRIPADGTYAIYSFVRDYATNNPGTRFANIAVSGTAMQTAGKHGQEGFVWEKIGEMTFKKGDTAKVTLLKTSAQYARIAAIMFTTEKNYTPGEDYTLNDFEAYPAETVRAFSENETNLVLLPDDFATDYGTWKNTKDGSTQILMGATSSSADVSDATAKIEIPADGTYYVWGYAKDYTSNSQGSRAAKVGVDRTALSGLIGVFGANIQTGASGAYGWDLAGKATLKAGTATISLKDVKKNYSRVAAVVLTTDKEFSGTDDFAGDAAKYRAKVVSGEYDFSNLYSNGNKLSFTFKNRTDKALDKAVIAAAIYTEDSKMVDMKTQKVESLAAYKSLNATDIAFEATDSWTTGKVMLLESLETMKPLRQFESFVYTKEDFANPDEGADTDYGSVTSYMPNYVYKNEAYAGKEYSTRGGIYNTLKKLKNGEDVTIAYLGGSITQQESWRPRTTQWFKENFKNSKITEVNIGLSGTNADLAVCRIDKDILTYNPDLVFIEYAVNGGAAKDMEGMVLKIWEKDPTTDVMFVYTTETKYYATYKSGKLPPYPAIYEPVADYYSVPSVFFGYQAFDLYEDGKLTLSGSKEDGKVLYTQDGVHLTGDGGFLAAGAIGRCINAMSKDFDDSAYTITNHTIPAAHYDANPWVDADYSDDWSKMIFKGSWIDCSLDPATNEFKNYSYTGGYLGNFKQMFPNMTGTKTAGSSVTVKFKGTDLAVFEAGGQYSGQLRVIIDGVEQPNKMVLYNNNDSKLRHQYYFIPTQAYGEHTVTFILDSTMPDKSLLQGRNPGDTTYERNELYIGKFLVVGEILDANE